MGELTEELRIARAITGNVSRISALTVLLPRLSLTDRPAVVDEILAAARQLENDYLRADALIALLPHLAAVDQGVVLNEATFATRNVSDAGCRSNLFARLASFLPEQDRAFALIEVLVGSSRLDADMRARALVEYAVKRGQPDQDGIFEEALEEVGRISDAETWLAAMKPLVDRLPDSLLQSLGRASRRIYGGPTRVRLLLELGDVLPESRRHHVLTEALVLARSQSNPADRVESLHFLSAYLRAEAATEILREALETIRSVLRGHEQTRALTRLAPALPLSLLEHALHVALAVRDEFLRMSVLTELAPSLPVSLHPNVITAIREVADQDLRVATFLKLSRILPRPFLNELSYEIQLISSSDKRADALVEMATLSPEDVRREVIALALKDARLIHDVISRVRLLLTIAASLTGAEQDAIFREAVAGVQGIEGQQRRINVLKELALAVPGQQFYAFLDVLQIDKDLVLPEPLELVELEQGMAHSRAYSRTEQPVSVDGMARSVDGMARGFDDSPASRQRVVNTGFALGAKPHVPLDPSTSLAVGEAYWFWLEVGRPNEDSIETVPKWLPRFAKRVLLKVTLTAIDDGITIDPNAAVGKLQVRTDGSTCVVSQPSAMKHPDLTRDIRRQRLFFPIQAGGQVGQFRFRCNIYYEQILVQSRLVSARITRESRSSHRALRSDLDFTLSGTLDPSHLKRMTPHQMSLFLVTDEKTLSFSFFGAVGDELVKRDARFDILELQDFIGQARGVLRRVAWGDEEDWQPTKRYRYGDKITFQQFKDDLTSLAIRGYRLYDAIIDRVTGTRERSDVLRQVMRKPGLIQIAIADSLRQHVPSTMFYDYRLETGVERDAYRICPGFLNALEGNAPLEKTDCFQGRCRSRESPDEDRTICPSGFWGFRHQLGMPLSVNSSLEAPPEIIYDDAPQMAVGVSTDPTFTFWPGHERVLRKLRESLGWHFAASRSDLFELLRTSKPHIVYFYCHGGCVNGVPYIQIGPVGEYGITRDNFRNNDIRWGESWPLIFINGCKTADLEPSKALELVSACIGSSASGVVGTEITLFEPLACAFAEAFLSRFLAGASLGEAILGARLALLKASNPLGLVYIPYALASLRLTESRHNAS